MSKYFKILSVIGVTLLATLACAGQGKLGKTETAAADGSVVAKIGERTISDAELEKAAGGSLMRLRQQMYEAKKKALEKYIYDLLVEEKAQAEGISSEEWLKKNLEDKIAPPAEAEIEAVLKQYRPRLDKDDERARNQVVSHLKNKARQMVEAGLMKKLMVEAGVRILLEPPKIHPKIVAHNPRRGPEDAPVTLVEYTDFQCPYCGRAQETLESLKERYSGSLRMVFKNLPLGMHQNSQNAAESALCAKDQGKFWEMHDWLFAHNTELEEENILKQAEVLGLDIDVFKTCLAEGIHKEEIEQDVEEAQSFGITGTPGFVINGQLLTGAQPVDRFEAIFDEELTRKGLKIPPKVEKPRAIQKAAPVKKAVEKADS